MSLDLDAIASAYLPNPGTLGRAPEEANGLSYAPASEAVSMTVKCYVE